MTSPPRSARALDSLLGAAYRCPRATASAMMRLASLMPEDLFRPCPPIYEGDYVVCSDIRPLHAAIVRSSS